MTNPWLVSCIHHISLFHVVCLFFGECIILIHSPTLCLGFEYTPLFEQFSLLWSKPVCVRQLRAKALRRRAPWALWRKVTYQEKACYASSPPCTQGHTSLFHAHKRPRSHAYIRPLFHVCSKAFFSNEVFLHALSSQY